MVMAIRQSYMHSLVAQEGLDNGLLLPTHDSALIEKWFREKRVSNRKNIYFYGGMRRVKFDRIGFEASDHRKRITPIAI
jgi:hypothetical protein